MFLFDATELVRAGGLAAQARSVVDRLPVEVGKRPGSPRDLPTLLVVDASGSMRYRGRQPPGKFDHARQFAAATAYLLTARLAAVGLALHDTKVRQFVPPRAGQKPLLGLLAALEAAAPGGESAVPAVWHRLSLHLQPPCRLVLLSDCFDEPGHIAAALRHLRRRGHEVLLLQVLAAEEIEFPFERPTRFWDLERLGAAVRLDPGRVRAGYRANFEAHLAALRAVSRDLGVGYHLLRTDEPVERALGAFLASRGR